MAYLTLIASLCIAGVAAWYSIVGLIAIFSAAVIPIAIMGSVLEVGKLVTATWLHRNWKHANVLLKSYLTIAVFLLMFITSMGIFGFLSKAHLEHSISSGGNNELQIEQLERRIAYQQTIITDAEVVLSQLDATVQTLIDYDRIRGESGAIAVRSSQAEEREGLNNTITDAYSVIEEFQTELMPLQKEYLSLQVEVGPLKYIAELIYGDEAENYFDEAVRWVIILLVVVFDPLAVCLLLAANASLRERKGENITFISEKDLVDDAPDYSDPEIDFYVEQEMEKEMELSETDRDQFGRLDKRVRNKLQWLIDKQNGGSNEVSP